MQNTMECQGPRWFSFCNTTFTHFVKYDFNKKHDSLTAVVSKSTTWYIGHSDFMLGINVAHTVEWCQLVSPPGTMGGWRAWGVLIYPLDFFKVP